MPVYIYSDGKEIIERCMTIEEKDAVQDYDDCGHFILIEGRKFYRDIGMEQRGTRSYIGNWPQYSDAVGVAENQVKDAIADSVEMGVPTHFNKYGQAEFTSRAHRKAYCEAYGFYDRNGGYGDPQKK